MSSSKGLFNKRFFSLVGTYVIACWGIVQFVDWLSNRYQFNSNWTDLIGLVALVLLPSVLLFSWLQTQEGRKFKKQGLVYGLNVGLAMLVSFFVFSGRMSAATTQSVTVTDENGELKEVEIAKQEYIRRVLFLPFENDDKQQWLSLAFPTLLGIDIGQSKMISQVSTMTVLDDLKELDYPIGGSIPQSVQADLLNKSYAEYVVSGSINQTKQDQYEYQVVVFKGQSSNAFLKKEGSSNDLFSMIDSLSVDINSAIFNKDLNIPLDEYKNIPAKEIYSSQMEAIKFYFQSILYSVNENYPTSIELADKAIELDNRFSEAYRLRGTTHYISNAPDKAKDDLEKALTHSKSTTDFQQYLIKAEYYRYQRDQSKYIDFMNMWKQIHPEDSFPFLSLANNYQGSRDNKKAIEIGHEAEAAGHKPLFLLRMARLYASEKNKPKVEEYIAAYKKEFPDNPDIQMQIGDIYISEGDYQNALPLYKEYKTLNPLNSTANIQLSQCQFQLGELAEAYTQLQEAKGLAKNFNDSTAVYNALESYYYNRGEIQKSIKTLQEKWAFSEPHYSKLQKEWEKISSSTSIKYVVLGREEEMKKAITNGLNQMGSISADYESYAWMNYYFFAEDADNFEKRFNEYKSFLQNNSSQGMFQAMEAYTKEFKGDYEGAISILESVVEDGSDDVAAYHLYNSYRRNKDFKKAVDGFEKLLDKAPYSGTYLVRYAEALADDGQVEKAKEVLLKLMIIWKNADPDYVNYKDALALDKRLNLNN